MKLSDLEALEQEYDARGYRVVFGVDCELTRDDGTGWPTIEEAIAVARRLRRVTTYEGVQVVAPDGLPVSEEEMNDLSPMRAPVASPVASPVAPQPDREALPVREGLPFGPVTVLASSKDWGSTTADELVLVGSGSGLEVYCCPASGLQDRGDVRWRPKMTSFEHLSVGDQEVTFHHVYWPQTNDLAATVAFWAGDGDGPGVWWVLRSRD